MPMRTTGLTGENARLHKNHSHELLIATWLMGGCWQVFAPLLDPSNASLLYAIAYVGLCWVAMALLYRKGLFLKI